MTNRVVGVERNSIKVADELETLARNEAAGLGANTLQPQTEAVAAVLASWSPVVLQTLPFPSVLIGSQDDPYCRMERARHFAARWGSQFVDYGNAGHINADSGLGDWPDGHDRLLDLCRASGALTAAARPPPQ